MTDLFCLELPRPVPKITPASKEIGRAIAHKARVMGTLRGLKQSRRAATRYIRGLMADRALVLAGLVETINAVGPSVGARAGLSAEDAVIWASQLDLRRSTKEAVYRKGELRLNGKERIVYVSQILEKTRQSLLHQIAKAVFDPHPNQFGAKGGKPGLEAWLKATLPDAELVITTDIPDCFNRAQRSVVGHGLPFARPVMKAALFDPMDRSKPLIRKPKSSLPETEAINCSYEQTIVAMSSPKRGVPQGSALSQSVSDALIKEILEVVETSATGVHVGAHGDNLIFVLEDASALTSVIQSLTSNVQTRFGVDVIGELIERIRQSAPQGPVFFCGKEYWIKKGELRVRTAEDRIDNYGLRLGEKIAHARDTGELGTPMESLIGWTAQNKNCHRSLVAALALASEIGATIGSAETRRVRPERRP